MKKNRIHHTGELLGALFLCPALLGACRSSAPSTRTDAVTSASAQTHAPAEAEVQPALPAPGAVTPVSPTRPTTMPSPPVRVYKTRKDYSHNVPVILNAERNRIESYPAPTDLSVGGRLMLPTALHDGYWLDNRGINGRVAFLSYTYEEYAHFTELPTMEQLMEHIIDKTPLTDLRDCGFRRDYKNIVEELNELIDNKFQKKNAQP
ncbi:MAG: hypothetical protein NC388_10035 [Clostridium sp.]|nr:hypothetical protein [Clostridium sp.]